MWTGCEIRRRVMDYKDCLVTTVKYTITQDSYEAISAKQEEYDSDGVATQLEDINANPGGISSMLDEIAFYEESILEDLENEAPGVEKTIVFYRPEEDEEGTMQVITLKNGETITHAGHEVSTEDMEDIINGMWYGSE
jgi:hypothetical protein